MSFRPMVKVGNEWAGNGVRFATREEAEASALDLSLRWTLVLDHRADESGDAVNCVWNPSRGNVHLEAANAND
jgi:hypothetical protein